MRSSHSCCASNMSSVFQTSVGFHSSLFGMNIYQQTLYALFGLCEHQVVQLNYFGEIMTDEQQLSGIEGMKKKKEQMQKCGKKSTKNVKYKNIMLKS